MMDNQRMNELEKQILELELKDEKDCCDYSLLKLLEKEKESLLGVHHE